MLCVTDFLTHSLTQSISVKVRLSITSFNFNPRHCPSPGLQQQANPRLKEPPAPRVTGDSHRLQMRESLLLNWPAPVGCGRSLIGQSNMMMLDESWLVRLMNRLDSHETGGGGSWD